MRKLSFISALLFASGNAVTAWGADLAKIDRTINKEPAYRGRPVYCLLVFGPQAKARVWLIRDGEVLYVDRDGSGDLTKKGNAVTGVRKKDVSEFVVDALTGADSKPPRGKLVVRFTGPSTSLRLRVEGKPPFFVDSIPDGELRFAEQAKHAPIIHFDGPLTFALAGPEVLARNGKDDSIAVVLGTPGLGRGTFAYLRYDDNMIPNNARPVGLFEFPSKVAGGKRIQRKVQFRRRG